MASTKRKLKYFCEDNDTIGAECPMCGRVLKIYKENLQLMNEGFASDNIVCICKHIFTEIEMAGQKRNTTCDLETWPTRSSGKPMKESKERIVAEISIKNEELRNARKDLEYDREYWDAHPNQVEGNWWRGHYDEIDRIEREIKSLKSKL